MKVAFCSAILFVLIISGMTIYKNDIPSLSMGSVHSPLLGDYVCWANPTQAALKKCKSCSGVGVYAWHPSEQVARKTAIEFCNKTYGKNTCVLDYCEKYKK